MLGAQGGDGGSQAEPAQSPAAERPVMAPVPSPCSATPGGAALLGRTQESRISVCGSHPTDSKTNSLDGRTDEATSQCPQPSILQEPVGEEEEEAAAWGWRWGPSSALPVHLPPTLMPPMGKNQAFVSLLCPPHLDQSTKATLCITQMASRGCWQPCLPACSRVHLSHTISPQEK